MRLIGQGSYTRVYVTDHDSDSVIMIGQYSHDRIKLSVLRYYGILITLCRSTDDRYVAKVKRLATYEQWSMAEQAKITVFTNILDKLLQPIIDHANKRSKYRWSILVSLHTLANSHLPIADCCAFVYSLVSQDKTICRGTLDYRTFGSVHYDNWLRDPQTRQLIPADLFNYR